VADAYAHTRAVTRGGRGGQRRLRVLLAVLLVCGAIAGLVWWELFRDRQPPIEGEIDETLVASMPLCVRDMQPPCRDVEEVARVLEQPRLVIRGAEQTTGGNQGVIALLVEGPDGRRAKAKWRTQSSASLFNTPAKELAAYQVQALLLEPADYVIPPIATHCFPIAEYRANVVRGAAPYEDTGCVLGFLSYWLSETITLPEARRAGLWPMPPDGVNDDDPVLFSRERFEEDPIYRRSIAILNLVTHVVNNRDAHSGQFVLYTEPWHAFLIDNSIAFVAIPNPRTLFTQDLSTMRVPSIPEDVATRIRALSRRDVERLRVIEEHTIAGGRLVDVEPGAAFDTGSHLRRRGDRVQIGLTPADVNGLWDRIAALQRELETGRLATF
jgi:hypothetical protein